MKEQDEFQAEDLDDDKTIEFIKNYLPQELKGKFTDDDLYYILDVIDDYYVNSEILNAQPDSEGCIDIDLGKVVDYVVAEAKKDNVALYDPEDIFFIVQGEMEYADTVWGEDQ